MRHKTANVFGREGVVYGRPVLAAARDDGVIARPKVARQTLVPRSKDQSKTTVVGRARAYVVGLTVACEDGMPLFVAVLEDLPLPFHVTIVRTSFFDDCVDDALDGKSGCPKKIRPRASLLAKWTVDTNGELVDRKWLTETFHGQ